MMRSSAEFSGSRAEFDALDDAGKAAAVCALNGGAWPDSLGARPTLSSLHWYTREMFAYASKRAKWIPLWRERFAAGLCPSTGKRQTMVVDRGWPPIEAETGGHRYDTSQFDERGIAGVSCAEQCGAVLLRHGYMSVEGVDPAGPCPYWRRGSGDAA